VKKTTKWRRIRPGYYRARASIRSHAVIERGDETGRWWWTVYNYGAGWHSGWALRLVDAQYQAGEVLR
jgi:hypothetical protein